MSPTDRPWFFADSLRVQFSLDVNDALRLGRINVKESQWLGSLVSQGPGEVVRPRVDRLLRGDDGLMHAELAGALLISDADDPAAEVYLCTPLLGARRFDSRPHLVSELTARFGQHSGDPKAFEEERIEGDVFEQRMLAIVDQQVRQLQRLTERLQRLPLLRKALGQTLQQQADARFPRTTINVLTHIVQLKQTDSTTQRSVILGSPTLVDVALDHYCNVPLPAGTGLRWLDAEGRELTEDQAVPWLQTITSVASGLVGVYENLLDDYWSTAVADGMTHRDLVHQAYAGCYARHLLNGRSGGGVTAAEYTELKTLCLTGEGEAAGLKVSRIALALGSQQPLKLAGVFLIAFTAEPLSDLFLYCATQGFRRFTSLDEVAKHFASIDARTEVFAYASANDRELLRTSGPVHVRLDRVDNKPLEKLTDAIIALQKRNLASVLKRSFSSPAQAAVTVDDALDIRQLIDPQLCGTGETGAWNDDMAKSEALWSSFLEPSRVAALRTSINDGDDAETVAWANYLRDARNRLDSILEAQPSVVDCAHRLLSSYFSVLHGGAVAAQRLWFRADDAGVVSLTVLLVERITGHREVEVMEGCEVFLDPLDSPHSTYLGWLTPGLLNHMLNRVQESFSREFPRQILECHGSQLRVSASSVTPANASRQIVEGLMRLELSMHRKAGEVSSHGLDMLEQVLDRPFFKLREHFEFEATEVSIPTLIYDENQPEVQLCDCLVLQQPLTGSAKPLLCCPIMGIREFASISELQLDLKARLAFPGSRNRWLGLIAEPDREKIQRVLKRSLLQPITVGMARVEGHFVERLTGDELSRQCQGIEAAYQTAVDWQVDVNLLNNMLTPMQGDDKARATIDKLSGQLESNLLAGLLPEWLSRASEQDLLAFRELVVHFWQLYTSRQEIVYLSTLADYARLQICARLEKDFPAAQLDPGRITITATHYSSAPAAMPGGLGQIPSAIAAQTEQMTQTLTGFAINRFSHHQDATLSVASLDSAPLPTALDMTYVLDLAKSLDIGAAYEQYLLEKFSATAPDYLKRLDQFIEQAPCALLLTAFQLKLQARLSSAAYDMIANVIGMPDGFARLPLNGRAITFSPLKLVAAEGYAADEVRGVYLIVPQDQGEGPWILHAVASSAFSLKEYASQSDFLTDLQTSEELQAMLLERLDPSVRFVYERGGFLQPHLSWASGGFMDLSASRPGPVQIRLEPFMENVLVCLFQAAQQIMLLSAKRRSVTNAQANRAESRFLLLLGAEQTLMFLPGRVGGLVGLWQAQDLLHSSLISAKDDEWGEALAEFVAALAVLISTSQQLHETPSQTTENSLEPDAPLGYEQQVQKDQELRFQQFEVHDVSLSKLEKNQVLNVFKDTVTLKHYAAVSGKVYQVEEKADGWRVTKGNSLGPRIRLDSEQHWLPVIELGVRQNGGALTRFKTTWTDRDVDDVFMIQARGVAQIQRSYPLKATKIVEAHVQAQTYLQNALQNLTVRSGRTLDPRTEHIIKEFFGVQHLSNRLVIPIKQALTDIYRLLLDPSLSPHASERYVVGNNKLGYEDTTAFTYTKDPLQRIFLTERFFSSPYVRLKPVQLRQGGFNSGAHYRSTVLIHELSHVAGNTEDIAYVDSKMPFLDLLEDAGDYRARLKREQAKAQNNLSHKTPRNELFRLEAADSWRDLKTSDGNAKHTILKITGASSIDAARDVFLGNDEIRSQIILSNADSVALLATLLGRERFIPE